jgi:hypothetical protein
VSLFALNEIWKQYEFAMSEDELLPCKGQFKITMGLPCAHEMRNLDSSVLQIENIHSQWRLDIKSFTNSNVHATKKVHFKGLLEKLHDKYQEWPIDKKKSTENQIVELLSESTSLVYEPDIHLHKGHPSSLKRKRKINSTRRDPPSFEFVENRRKCSKCKEVGHNSRTCKSVVKDYVIVPPEEMTDIDAVSGTPNVIGSAANDFLIGYISGIISSY